ncbi:hypothetical protein BDR05DRAFT_944714 [Suillus weaverae]|nr:hypothetical protein BDR05DRAFT_944714 [Suillus weaverae]
MRVVNNTPPCLPEYLNQIVKMLTSWQIDALDNPGLFNKFATHRFNVPGDLMLLTNEQTSAYMLLLDIRRQTAGPDPLLNNLQVIRDDLEQFRTKLQDWLVQKMKDGSIALEEMTCLKDFLPVLKYTVYDFSSFHGR